jgi:very-short-patch-repair endonuclease
MRKMAQKNPKRDTVRISKPKEGRRAPRAPFFRGGYILAKPKNWDRLSDGQKINVVRKMGNDRINFLIRQAREVTEIDVSVHDKPRLIDTLRAAIGTLQMRDTPDYSNIEDMEMMLEYLELG